MAAVPSLKRCCLQLLASALLDNQPAQHHRQQQLDEVAAAYLRAGACQLPEELQLDLLLLLASWQQLGDAACALLCGVHSGSALSGAASLSLAGCVLLGRPSLRRLLGSPLPQLQSLNLRGLPALTDAEVALVAQHCPSLTRLDLSNARSLTSAAVAAVTSGPAAPRLQALSMAGCWRVAALPGLTACTALTSLNLAGCWQLTDDAVREALTALPLLEELSLAGCCHLGAGALVAATLPPSEAAALEGARGALHQRHAAARDAQPPAGQEGEQLPLAVRQPLLKLGFPTQGAALPLLRSLDVSGTKANDCLLLWVATRCCARLQKLVLSSSQCSGRSLGLLLRAKRALLHAGSPGALPLLELSGLHSAEQEYSEDGLAQAACVQRDCEAQLGGGVPIHSADSSQPPLMVSALQPPTDAEAAVLPAPWPPESAAEVLAALGPRGLGQLQALDAAGCSNPAALADLLASQCSSLQRLSLAGCASLADASLAQVLRTAPGMRDLNVSGCKGGRVSRPGSRFLRHGKAQRLQEGGVSDASLALLAQQQQQQQQQQEQEQEQQQQQQHSAAAASGSTAPAAPSPAPAGLQALNAGGLSATGEFLAKLPGSLTALSLRRCRRVCDTGMLQLLARCRALARLDAVGASQLSASGFGCWMATQEQEGLEQHEWPQPAQDQVLQLFRRVRTTSAAVQLQRAALPKRACTREVLAWLVGAARSAPSLYSESSSSSSSSYSSGPPGAALQRLELASCASLLEVDLLAVAACCPSLKALLLPAAGPVAGGRLCVALAQRCRLLTRLTLCGSATLEDGDVALLLHELPALQHLDCSQCGRLRGLPFIEHLPAVVPAAAAGSSEDAAASAAARARQQQPAEPAPPAPAGAAAGERGFALRTLRLDGCQLLDDAAVVAIAGTCPHLEELSLVGCDQLTPAAVAAAMWACVNLRQLSPPAAPMDRCRVPPGGMPPAFPAVSAAAGRPCPAVPDLLLHLESVGTAALRFGGPTHPSALTHVWLPPRTRCDWLWTNVAAAFGEQCQVCVA